jgi:hypothetical protein
MKLLDLIPLKEIDFSSQKAFDAYNQKHKMKPDTKVTIAGKKTTAGQAAQKSEPVKGASVFGNKTKSTDVKSKAKELLSKSDYTDKSVSKLKDTADDLYNDLGVDADSKELALKLKKNIKGLHIKTYNDTSHILFDDGTHYKVNTKKDGSLIARKVQKSEPVKGASVFM